MRSRRSMSAIVCSASITFNIQQKGRDGQTEGYLPIRFVLSSRPECFHTFIRHRAIHSNLEVGMLPRPRLPFGENPSRVVLARFRTTPRRRALSVNRSSKGDTTVPASTRLRAPRPEENSWKTASREALHRWRRITASQAHRHHIPRQI